MTLAGGALIVLAATTGFWLRTWWSVVVAFLLGLAGGALVIGGLL